MYIAEKNRSGIWLWAWLNLGAQQMSTGTIFFFRVITLKKGFQVVTIMTTSTSSLHPTSLIAPVKRESLVPDNLSKSLWLNSHSS